MMNDEAPCAVERIVCRGREQYPGGAVGSPFRTMSAGCLLLAALLLFTGCGVIVRGAFKGGESVVELFYQGRHGSLTEQEKTWAKIAWSYFKNNHNPNTGVVGAVDKYPSVTMWHVADYLAALVSAHELELISRDEFDQRMSVTLHFLNTMELFEGKLPNKVYHAQTGAMVNYENKPEGIGWSAVDIGRLLVWLEIVKCMYPVYEEYVDAVVLRWSFCDIVDSSGGLLSAAKVNEKVQLYREKRLGYEQYAAKGFQAWGFDTTQAFRQLSMQDSAKIYGIEIPIDSRNPKESGTYSPVLSTGFLLDGMEFNWDLPVAGYNSDRSHGDPVMAHLAEAIYKVQEARYENEHILTARTDHQLGDPPYFVYDSIFAAGYPWNVISDTGEYHREAAIVATKAAFGMWVLWKTPYTSKLIEAVASLHDGERGWYEGRREKTGGYLYVITCSTNSSVLESLLYKVRGRLMRCSREPDSYYRAIRDPFRLQGRCFPFERECKK
jgi:hypothetical protein